ncbi:MAG: polysaccharide deacetylase family protein [Candidatus Omnitrophota bacterium]
MVRKNKKLILLFIVLLALSVFFFWAKEQYVAPILMYHNIDNNAHISRLSVTPYSFQRQMAFLKRHGYNVVSLPELADLVKKKKIPYKTVSITFDDGYENNYKNAYPVLKKYGIKATIFITPFNIGKEGYLTWEQVKEMAESDVIDIGSHSMNHAFLPNIPEEDLDVEIGGSKKLIEEHINRAVDSFSYPVGGFHEKSRAMVRDAGYKIAMTTNPGKKYPKHDIFAMKRQRISATSDNLLVFWIESSGFYTWIKEHRDDD